MDTFKSMLFISVCGLVARTFAKNVSPKLRQTIKRLDDLERKTHMKNIDTELKFDDVLQAISILNTSHCDVSTAGGIDSHLGVDDAFNDELDIKHARNAVQDVMSHLKLGFKEEKSVRKHAIVSMKQDMETVENDLRTAVRTELVKVNDAIGADRNVTMDMAIQLDILQAGLDKMHVEFGKSVARIRMQVTHDLNDGIHALKTSAADNRAMLFRRIEKLELLYRTDKLSQINRCKIDEGDDPREWNGHWYILVKKRVSYDRATIACGKCNAHLVDIQSDEEDNFVCSLATSLATNYVTWLGLTDVSEEGVWRWHHNKETSRYFHWDRGEPNDDGGHEDCVAIVHHKSAWNDVSCGSEFAFICKL